MKPPSSRDVQTDAHVPNRRETANEQTVIIGDGSVGGPQNSIAGAAAHPAPPPPSPVAPAPTPPPARDVPKPNTLAQPDVGHTRLLAHPGVTAQSGMDKGAPVVGWLVVEKGPGKGNFRPVYPGSNTIGRSPTQRIPIDFGDDSISGEKQAYLIYDGRKRQFQIAPNLEKSNLAYLNDSAVLANTEIKAKDRLTIGQTTLLFMPLCGEDFDWADVK